MSWTGTGTGGSSAIVADLDRRRHDFHVAIENWQHDLNIGTVVRTANAFLAREVHIVGRRRWNRRGAMVTDRYQHLRHHEDVAALVHWAQAQDLVIVGVDNLPGAVPIESVHLPRRCLLLFGQEGPGLSDTARDAAAIVCSIAQYGSTQVDQCRRGQCNCDAHVDSPACRTAAGGANRARTQRLRRRMKP